MLPPRCLTMAILVTLASCTNPRIVPGSPDAKSFSEQQEQQIKDAFGDAQELAAYAIMSKGDEVDTVFQKYFKAKHFPRVKQVFQRIRGDDPNDPTGNALLGHMTVSGDFVNPSNGKLTCTNEYSIGGLREGDSDTPIIILCDTTAAFGHGGIDKGYDNPPVAAVTCGSLDDQTSWKMNTLGATLMHEYTHWDKLVTPILSEGTIDLAYGPYKTQNMNKNEAIDNADSFAWAATELLWTMLCEKEYGAATKEDDNDPNCGNEICGGF